MITSDLIKEKAIELGFHKVGIAKAAKTEQEQKGPHNRQSIQKN